MAKKPRKTAPKASHAKDAPIPTASQPRGFGRSLLIAGGVVIVAIVAGQLWGGSAWTMHILGRSRALSPMLAEVDAEPRAVPGLSIELQPAKSAKLKPLVSRYRELWGSWRPQVYFGVRAAMPPRFGTPVFGVAWIDSYGMQKGRLDIRHGCEQGHGLKSYAWRRHNGRDFGLTRITDRGDDEPHAQVLIDAAFVGQGPHWSANFDVNVTNAKLGTLFIVYVLDESGAPVSMTNVDGVLCARGKSKALGEWKMEFILNDHSPEERHERLTYWISDSTHYLHTLEEDLLKGVYRGTIEMNKNKFINLASLSLPGKEVGGRGHSSNMAAFGVRVGDALSSSISVDVAMSLKNPPLEFQAETDRALHGKALKEEIKKRLEAHEERLDSFLNWGTRKTEEYHFREMVSSAIANMLGGIGYFYGSTIVRSTADPKMQSQSGLTGPLLTAVPSRPFFPRGFLWDEGFHQLLIRRWDRSLSLTIIAHWLDLMTESGWIPREQILGEESARRVPSEFIVQEPKGANPPTLLLALSESVDYYAEQPEDSEEAVAFDDFLKKAYPRLLKWISWYNTTQAGPVEGSFRWRGREKPRKGELNPKTLTSGLDDFPRASHPSSQERHVDLLCWMSLASDLMAKISAKAGADPAEVRHFEEYAKKISSFEHINALHLDPETGRYFDWGNHSDGVKLVKQPQKKLAGYIRGEPQYEVVQVIKRYEDPDSKPKPSFVRHFGYISLFPFLMKLIPPDSTVLNQLLDDLKDPELLWSPYGLRSIAKSSSFYMAHNTEHDGPYWRGPIWININYMALGALHHYNTIGGPYSDKANGVYQDLRRNILDNIFKWYKQSGFLWENYNSEESGKGQGSHPFTGWTALVVLIYSEQYQ